MKTRFVFFVVSLLLLVSLAPVAFADEITFQASEVDVGQSSVDVPISGDEWLSYGINMSGTDLYVYDDFDPFIPDDRNGIFENAGSSYEIEFANPAVNLDVSWWSPGSVGVTITAYDASGVEIDAQTSSEEFDVFSFGGAVKRIMVEAPPGTLCIANLKFNNVTLPALPVPTLTQLGLIIMIMAMLVFGGLVLRRRIFSI